jgi:UDP-N-acetyl-D-galactosamine dehydrogenase
MDYILRDKIANEEAVIGIIGLGYVGLPLAQYFSKKFSVVGYDKNKKRINELKNNVDINDIKIKKKKLININFSHSSKILGQADIIIITTPTPVKKNNYPDLKCVLDALKSIVETGLNKKLVILESTVFPNASNELFIRFLEKKAKLKINKDFYFGYSPERINPGDEKKTLYNIDKIVSGSNKYSTDLVKRLYKKIIKKVHVAKNILIAETAKVIENCQRDINIAFINEIALICNKLKISTHEVLRLASTKWNFLKFKPGLVGGHCISVDPYYLTYKLKKLKYKPKIILAGRKLNENIPNFIVSKFSKIIKLKKNKTRILLMGVSYKPDCNDFRNSKSLKIADLLMKKKINLDIYEPYFVKKDHIKNYAIKKYSFISKKKIKKNFYDAIIISVEHKIFKKIGFEKISKFGKKNCLIFDVKSIFPGKKILYL